MKRLWVKLVGTISLLLIFGSGAIYTSVQIFTKNQYKTLVHAGDIAAAEELSWMFSAFYAEQESWEGLASFITDFRSVPMNQMGMMPGGRMGPGMPRRGQEGGGIPPRRFPLLASRIVITTPAGNVVYDSAGELQGTFHPPGHITKGAPVLHAGSVVGYLFVGTMIEPALNPGDREFLTAVNKAVLFTAFGIVVLAVFAGSLLVLQITSPVKRLSSASSRVAAGDFSVRVDSAGKDEIGNLTRQFNKMAESLQRAEASRKRMIADSAHELRTPVSLIQGKLEMILDGVYTADREHLTDILEETRVLSRLIGELQDLADADAGGLLLKRENFDLRDVIGRAAAMHQQEIEAAGVRLEAAAGTEELPIFGDRQKLYQVLTNLLTNALRHTSEGGTIRIASGTEEKKKEKIRISVYNSGPRIPEDKLEAVFERFYRLDSARNREHGGKGLGLAISKAIVEAHGGRIWAENVPAGGVRFTAELPLG
jgi:signal transduction histidine kinase